MVASFVRECALDGCSVSRELSSLHRLPRQLGTSCGVRSKEPTRSGSADDHGSWKDKQSEGLTAWVNFAMMGRAQQRSQQTSETETRSDGTDEDGNSDGARSEKTAPPARKAIIAAVGLPAPCGVGSA